MLNYILYPNKVVKQGEGDQNIINTLRIYGGNPVEFIKSEEIDIIGKIICPSPRYLSEIIDLVLVHKITCIIDSDEQLEMINELNFCGKIEAVLIYEIENYDLITNPKIYYNYPNQTYIKTSKLLERVDKLKFDVSDKKLCMKSGTFSTKTLVLHNTTAECYIDLNKFTDLEAVHIKTSLEIAKRLMPNLGDVTKVKLLPLNVPITKVDVTQIIKNDTIKVFCTNCLVKCDKEVLQNNFTLIKYKNTLQEGGALHDKVLENKQLAESARFKKIKPIMN